MAEAWAHRAPIRLAEQHRAASTSAVGTELPAIGKPATRALTGRGITTLDQVATWSEADLLALHGVGPRAIRILGEALAESGRTFRTA